MKVENQVLNLRKERECPGIAFIGSREGYIFGWNCGCCNDIVTMCLDLHEFDINEAEMHKVISFALSS